MLRISFILFLFILGTSCSFSNFDKNASSFSGAKSPLECLQQFKKGCENQDVVLMGHYMFPPANTVPIDLQRYLLAIEKISLHTEADLIDTVNVSLVDILKIPYIGMTFEISDIVTRELLAQAHLSVTWQGETQKISIYLGKQGKNWKILHHIGEKPPTNKDLWKIIDLSSRLGTLADKTQKFSEEIKSGRNFTKDQILMRIMSDLSDVVPREPELPSKYIGYN